MTKDAVQGFSLKDFTCTVTGLGGLGCNIAVHLAGAGVGRLILCDFDKVSESNLNRQFLYTKEDVGKSKADSAKSRLSLYAPEISIASFDIKIGKDPIPEIIKASDMIFLAVDNKKARENIASFCEKEGIPLMMGGIDGFYGKTYLYVPQISPTPKKAGMLEGKKAQSNISATAGVIGSLQAATGIQYLLTGDKSLGGVLTVFDKNEFSQLNIK